MENKIKKAFSLFIYLFISAAIAWLLLLLSTQSRKDDQNQEFHDLNKIINKKIENKQKEIFIYTLKLNEYDKYHLINLPKEKNCNITKNEIVYKNLKSEIWEINCEK